jgi:serine/threonine-protein kinase
MKIRVQSRGPEHRPPTTCDEARRYRVSLFSEFKERRLFRIVAGYTAAGWIVLSGVDQLVDREVLPRYFYLIGLVWYVGGFFAATILGWYHGEKGRQKATANEIALLSGLGLVVALFTGSIIQRNLTASRAETAASIEGGLDPHTIAVLYFEDASSEGELQHIADGLTEGLIDELAQVPSLSVVSRNGSGQVRGLDLPYDSVGRILDAGTIVHGTVDQTRDRVEVDVSLRDGTSGAPFRRASFQRSSDELLDVQSDLAEEVSVLLRGWLGEEVDLRRVGSGTEVVAAWALLQRAEKARKDAEDLIGDEDEDAVLALFQQADSLGAEAEALDPEWVDPILVRGWAQYRRARLEGDPLLLERELERAFEHAERGRALAPNDPRVLELLGTLYFTRWVFNLEPDTRAADELIVQAGQVLDQATARNPRQAYAWNILSLIRAAEDDLVAANMAARRAYEADAYLAQAEGIVWRLWTTSYDLGVAQQAQFWCEEGRGRFPDNPRFYECELFNMTMMAGEPDIDRAWELVEEVVQRTPEHLVERSRLKQQIGVAGALARAQMPDSARAVLGRSRGDRQVDPNGELIAYEAFTLILLGEEDEAIDRLAEFLALNPQRVEGFRAASIWWWQPLEDNPAYRRLIGVS